MINQTRTIDNWFSLLVIASVVIGIACVLMVTERYSTINPQIIAELNDPKNSEHWQESGNGDVAYDGGVLSIENTQITSHNVTLITAVSAGHYRVSVGLWGDVLVGGDEPWHGGSLIVIYQDENGDRLGSSTIARLAGAQPKQSHDKLIHTDANTASILVVARLTNSSGMMYVENLTIAKIEDSDTYKVLLWISIALWALIALYLLYAIAVKGPKWVVVPIIGCLALMLIPDSVISSVTRRLFESIQAPEATRNYASSVAHFFLFIVLGIAVPLIWSRNSKLYLALCLITFAVFTESVQVISRSRNTKLDDLLFDFAGVLIGIVLISGVLFLYQKVKSLAGPAQADQNA